MTYTIEFANAELNTIAYDIIDAIKTRSAIQQLYNLFSTDGAIINADGYIISSEEQKQAILAELS